MYNNNLYKFYTPKMKGFLYLFPDGGSFTECNCVNSCFLPHCI